MASLKSLKGRARSLTPGMPKKLVLLPSANTSQSYSNCCPPVSVMVPPDANMHHVMHHVMHWSMVIFHSNVLCAVVM